MQTKSIGFELSKMMTKMPALYYCLSLISYQTELNELNIILLLVKELGNAGTYGGNDSIVAFSRCYGVNIVIHQLNERCWVIEGDKYRKPDDPKRDLHISYHNGDHYSSVRRIGDPINGPAWMYNNKEKVFVSNQCLYLSL